MSKYYVFPFSSSQNIDLNVRWLVRALSDSGYGGGYGGGYSDRGGYDDRG